MEALRARLFSTRYYMPANAVPSKSRLDRLQREVATTWLPEALDREGFGRSELICLRRVNSRVRLRLASSDESLAAAWAMTLATSVRQAVEAGSPDVVRYRSRAEALLDLTERVIDGRWERVWAWKQLGLLRASSTSIEGWSSAPDEVLREVLIAEPQWIAAILAAVVRRGRGVTLWSFLPPRHWMALARAAWAAHGGRAAETLHAQTTITEWLVESTGNPLASRTDRILRESVLLASMRPYLAHRQVDETLLAAAALAVLECEPQAPLREESAMNLIAQVASRTALPSEPETQSAMPEPRAPRGRPQPNEPAGSLETQTDCLRVHAESRFGGLLFLLHVIEALELADSMMRDLPARPMAWTLHRLALALIPVGEDDPAVLAFAGLGPEAPPPSRDELPPTEEEEVRLAQWAAAILEALQLRLSELRQTGPSLLRFVCMRSCTILADPGWIEIHFSLSDVSTDIRRARLDLDPGFVPWLGVTVVFVYE